MPLLLERALPASFWALYSIAMVARSLDLWLRGPASEGSAPFTLLALSTLLNISFLFTLTVLYMIRKERVGEKARPSQVVFALLATFVMGLVAFLPATPPGPQLLVVANTLMALGLGLALMSLWHLGRCFAIAPEARGLVTGGPYRLMRHPVYAGEMIASLGVALSFASPYSLALFVVFCALQVRRALWEEEALARVFPEYASYRTRTGRFVPSQGHRWWRVLPVDWQKL